MSFGDMSNARQWCNEEFGRDFPVWLSLLDALGDWFDRSDFPIGDGDLDADFGLLRPVRSSRQLTACLGFYSSDRRLAF